MLGRLSDIQTGDIHTKASDFRFPGTDAERRAHWEAELERLGPEGLHGVLAVRDPAAAAAIGPYNGRRLVRALEVGAWRRVPRRG